MAVTLLYFVPVFVAFALTPNVESTSPESGTVYSDASTDGDLRQRDFLPDTADGLGTTGISNHGISGQLYGNEDNQASAQEPSRRHPIKHRRRHSRGKTDIPNSNTTLPESEIISEKNKDAQYDDQVDSSELTDNSHQVTSGSVPANSEYNTSDTDEQRREETKQTQSDASTSEVAITAATPTPNMNRCHKCGDKEKQKVLQVDLVKQTLLKKLRLAEAPKVDGPIPPLPFDFYLGDDFTVGDARGRGGRDEVSVVKTREIFVFGEDVTHKCQMQKSSGCYSFELDSLDIDADDVSSVELWIYKQANPNDQHIQTFMVSELSESAKGGERPLRTRNIVKRIETRLKYGWMKIYVRRTVTRWLQKPHRNHGLAVVCKTCQRQNYKAIYGNKKGLRPILVFYMKNGLRSRRRYRRDVQCVEGGNNCCHMEALEITFRDIGWDYIMAPASIRPNFCTGSCNGIQAAHYNHTRLVQTLQQSVMHDYGSQLQPCCSPVAFQQPQSLLYRDNMGVVRKIDVPDLLVGQCGCT